MTTYDQWQAWAPQIEAALIAARGQASGGDFAHFLYNLDVERRSLEWVLWDIGGRHGAEPSGSTPPSAPVPPTRPTDPGPPGPPVPAGLTPRLHVEGTKFVTDAGHVFQWFSFSLFLAPRRFWAGEDLREDFAELRRNGRNMIRVFGPLDWPDIPDYNYAHFNLVRLGEFFAFCAAEGFYVEFVIGCYRFGNEAEQQRFAQRVFDIAQHYPNVLIEAVNEPSVQADNKPDPIAMLKGVDRHGVLTAYGYYHHYYDPVLTKRLKTLNEQHAKATGAAKKKLAAEIDAAEKAMIPPTLDYGTIHIQRDSAWFRKARHAQELQSKTGKPCVNDEEAKIVEPGFEYTGGKNDPATTPAEAIWSATISTIYGTGNTLHTQEGVQGRVPTRGMLQHTVLVAVNEAVCSRIGPEYQGGAYKGAHSGGSPVDGKDLKIDGQDIWTYSSVLPNDALAVRCALSAPQPIDGWLEVDRWGPAGSIVRLER